MAIIDCEENLKQEYLKEIKFARICIAACIKSMRKMPTVGSIMGHETSSHNPKFKEWLKWHDGELAADITAKCDKYDAERLAIEEKLSAQDLTPLQLKQIFNEDIQKLLSQLQVTIKKLTDIYSSQIQLVGKDSPDIKHLVWLTEYVKPLSLPDRIMKAYCDLALGFILPA